MNLVDEYARQAAWRDWPALCAELPPLAGRTVLDLGCAIGDQAAELVARGARVVGIDGNEALLEHARARGLPNAEFRRGDLRQPIDISQEVDGIWASFLTAYFPDIEAGLGNWTMPLRPGGWIALTEIDGLFRHEPLGARARQLLAGYSDEARSMGRYDFQMGRRLPDALRACGFTLITERDVADGELSFSGPASPEVLAAWRTRFDRLTLLQAFCGAEYPAVRDEFLDCLARPDHRSAARVRFCLATR
jgi:SAM-dependent methyltransferase